MAVGKHEQETMVEQEENVLTCQFQTGEPQKVPDDAADGKPISVVAKLRTVVHRHRFPPMVKSFTFSDAVNWMRHGGPWRGYLIAAVGIATFVAVTAVVAFGLLFISSSLNAAFASFFVAVSTVCFIMAFFFSSITVVYVGALGFGGLTIGSIAFFSVWAVIVLSGWGAIAWVIWQGLRKAFQFGRRLAFLAGSFLLSFPAAQKLQHFGAKFEDCRYSPMKSKNMAMD